MTKQDAFFSESVAEAHSYFQQLLMSNQGFIKQYHVLCTTVKIAANSTVWHSVSSKILILYTDC